MSTTKPTRPRAKTPKTRAAAPTAHRRRLTPPAMPPAVALGRELSARTVMFHQAVADRVGLNVTDHKCLDLLDRHGAPMTAGELARASGLTSGAITGVVDRLERAGFVRRESNPDDRRQVRIAIDPEAMRAYEPLFTGFGQAVMALFHRFDARDQAVIQEYMRGVIDILREQTERLRDER